MVHGGGRHGGSSRSSLSIGGNSSSRQRHNSPHQTNFGLRSHRPRHRIHHGGFSGLIFPVHRPQRNTVININAQDVNPLGRADDWDGDFYDEEAGESCDCCCCCPWVIRDAVSSRQRKQLPGLILLTGIVLAVLVVISSKNETWTMNAGESRRITTGLFTNTIRLDAVSSGKDTNVTVYALRDKECPPLTGKPVSINKEENMAILYGDYQYDYFYLNKGSKINVKARQSQGASQLLLLRGQDILSRLEKENYEDDWDDFRRKALLKRYIKDGDSWEITDFRSPVNDVYILVYDNVSSSKTAISVEYSIELTTYHLDGYTPFCSSIEVSGCPPIHTSRAVCIIVDTSPSSRENSHDVPETTIRVAGTRRWFSILLISFLPGVVIIAWEYYLAKKREGWHALNGEDVSSEVVQNDMVPIPPPMTPPDNDNVAVSGVAQPMPTAPVGTTCTNASKHPSPSAPVEEDTSTIPVAQATEIIHEPSSHGTSAPAPIEISPEQVILLPTKNRE